MMLTASLVLFVLGVACLGFGTAVLRKAAGQRRLSLWTFPEGAPVLGLLLTAGGAVIAGIGAIMIQDFGRRPVWLSLVLIAVLALVWVAQVLLHNRAVTRDEGPAAGPASS